MGGGRGGLGFYVNSLIWARYYTKGNKSLQTNEGRAESIYALQVVIMLYLVGSDRIETSELYISKNTG